VVHFSPGLPVHLDLAPFRQAGLGLSLDEFERLVMDAVAQVCPNGRRSMAVWT